jgi:hypothetical protein
MLRTIRQRAGQPARTQGPAGLSPRARRRAALTVAGGLAMPLLAGACSGSAASPHVITARATTGSITIEPAR